MTLGFLRELWNADVLWQERAEKLVHLGVGHAEGALRDGFLKHENENPSLGSAWGTEHLAGGSVSFGSSFPSIVLKRGLLGSLLSLAGCSRTSATPSWMTPCPGSTSSTFDPPAP